MQGNPFLSLSPTEDRLSAQGETSISHDQVTAVFHRQITRPHFTKYYTFTLRKTSPDNTPSLAKAKNNQLMSLEFVDVIKVG